MRDSISGGKKDAFSVSTMIALWGELVPQILHVFTGYK